MGIPYLSSFVQRYFSRWRQEEIKGYLIIDGTNLRFGFYHLNWTHGGQFPEFRENLILFFESLRQCDITPIVVLDGKDYDRYTNSFDIVISRREKRIQSIENKISDENEVNRFDIFPPLASNVYLQVLIDLEIQHVVVDGRTDCIIAEMANFYECPVLSNDSDFFMYKLKRGCILKNNLDLSKKSASAKVYHYENFCEQFGFTDSHRDIRRDISVRLIIPALLGNDYFSSPLKENNQFKSFILRKVQLEDEDYHKARPAIRYAYLFYSLASFKERVSNMNDLSDDKKEQLKENCAQLQEMYDTERVLSVSDIAGVTDLRTYDNEKIPKWILKNYRAGLVSKFVMIVMVLRKFILPVYVDDTNKESCTLASQSIRRYIYGLINPHMDSVQEYVRVGLRITGRVVDPITIINGNPLPTLEEIPTLSSPERENILYSILKCDEKLFQDLEACLKLAVAATVFWSAISQPSCHLVKSLLLCFTVCFKCDGRDLAKMRSEFTIDEEFRRSPLWMKNLHTFAEWQCIYKTSVHLNGLLSLPLTVLSPASLYDGKLVMYFAMPRNLNALVGRMNLSECVNELYKKLTGTVLDQ